MLMAVLCEVSILFWELEVRRALRAPGGLDARVKGAALRVQGFV